MTISNQEYVSGGFNTCPVCGTSDIVGGSVEIDCNYAIQDCNCNSCYASWRDSYTLSDISEVEDKDGNEIEVVYD